MKTSTTTSISCTNLDGTISTIYCLRTDLFWFSQILTLFYKDYNRVKKLIEIGNLESIGRYLNEEEQPESDRISQEKGEDRIDQSRCIPIESRESSDNKALTFSSKIQWQTEMINRFEYNYIFDKGEWYQLFHQYDKGVIYLKQRFH